MKFPLPLLLLTLPLLITSLGGCDPNIDTSNEEDTLEQFTFFSEAEAHEKIQNAQVRCETHNCHPSVALTLIHEPGSATVNTCTAFAISPNLVLTNAHCVPTGPHRLFFIWPEMPGHPRQMRESQEVILRGDIEEESMDHQSDYAYITLSESTTRPALNLEPQALEDLTRLTAFTFNPQGNSEQIKSTLYKKTCTVRERSIINPRGDAAYAINKTIADCRIIGGNSGAPLLNANGGVAGIVYARFVRQSNLSEMHFGVDQYPRTIAPLGLMVNAACLPLNARGQKISPLHTECAPQTLLASRQSNQRNPFDHLSSALSNLSETSERNNPTAFQLFEWTLTQQQDQFNRYLDTYASIKPTCIKPIQQWKDLVAAQGDEVDLTIELPILKVSYNLTRYLQLESNGETTGQFNLRIKFSLEALINQKQVSPQIDILPSHPSQNLPTIEIQNLRFCD